MSMLCMRVGAISLALRFHEAAHPVLELVDEDDVCEWFDDLDECDTGVYTRQGDETCPRIVFVDGSLLELNDLVPGDIAEVTGPLDIN